VELERSAVLVMAIHSPNKQNSSISAALCWLVGQGDKNRITGEEARGRDCTCLDLAQFPFW
jgi:hypothetical protein